MISRFGLGLLPMIELFLTGLTFVVSYVIAASSGDVNPAFPYISDAGARPPESCIFTFGLCLSAYLALCIIFIRYKHVSEYHQQDVERILRLNRISFYIGCLSPIGMLLVASFQDINVISVHVLGAAMAFGFGCLYAWMQTYMSWRMRSVSQRILDVRFVISLLSTAACISAILFAGIASRQISSYSKGHVFHWHSNDPGYHSHVVSTASEWACGLLFLIFFLTYVKDFMRISLDVQLRLRVRTSLFVSADDGASARLTNHNNDGQDDIW